MTKDSLKSRTIEDQDGVEKMFLTGEDVSDLSDDAINVEDCGSGRWQEYKIGVVKIADRFWRISWNEGLTESQEDTYDDQWATEVFQTTQVNVSANTEYLTPEEKNSTTLLENVIVQNVSDLKMLSTDHTIDEEIAKIVEFDLEPVIEMLKSLEAISAIPRHYAHAQATIHFLEALRKLKNETK